MINAFGLRWLSWALMFAGLSWVALLLSDALRNPYLMIPTSWIWLGIATLLILISVLANGLIFNLFLHAEGEEHLPLLRVFKLHYSAQILRYLPGRVWGVLYQIGSTQGEISALRIARANIDWMIFSIFGSSSIAFLLIFHRVGAQHPEMLLLAMISIILAFSFVAGFGKSLLRLPAVVMPAKARKALEILASCKIANRKIILAIGILFVSWFFYITGWMLLEKVFPIFAASDLLLLCAYYTLASVIGIVSALTPAGLGVREAAFIFLTGGVFGGETVAFFALFSRIWLMVIDVALLAISVICIYDARMRNK